MFKDMVMTISFLLKGVNVIFKFCSLIFLIPSEPTAAAILPQFELLPKAAVLTKIEFATAKPISFACLLLCASMILISINLV